MADTILHPTEIEPTPFPGEAEILSPQTQTGSKDIISPTTTKSKAMPTKRVAVELLSSALNTRSKKVLGNFELVGSGGFQVGKYENGVSGDVRLTPNGMTARNAAGNTTFAIDGDTGDATFLGIIQAGSVISAFIQATQIIADTLSAISSDLGEVNVGGNGNGNGVLRIKDTDNATKITLDKDGIAISTGKISINNGSDSLIFDASGIVSTAQFASGSVTGTTTTTGSSSYVDVTGASIGLTLSRSAKVLIIISGSMSNSNANNGDSAAVCLNIDNTDDVGPIILNAGSIYSSGVMANTGAVSTIQTLGAGSHTLKLRLRTAAGGGGTALVGFPTISYAVLGT